ncbi:MAG TPA: hypothetical protein VKD28_16885 [Gemmatimonadales bacterium]|nr:hypothetical protein [Gemmatimonadales bacterium]
MAALLIWGQAPDQQNTCRDLESRAFTLGTWMSHNWTGGQMTGSKTRVAVVGTELQDRVPYYWFEVSLDDPARPASKMTVQLLAGGPGSTSAGIRKATMKMGSMPPMTVPPSTVQMFNGINVAQIARECRSMQLVAWDDLSVPAGKFRAMHLRDPRTSADFWITPGAQSGIVKLIWKDGSTAVLTAQGSDAKSSLTGMP